MFLVQHHLVVFRRRVGRALRWVVSPSGPPLFYLRRAGLHPVLAHLQTNRSPRWQHAKPFCSAAVASAERVLAAGDAKEQSPRAARPVRRPWEQCARQVSVSRASPSFRLTKLQENKPDVAAENPDLVPAGSASRGNGREIPSFRPGIDVRRANTPSSTLADAV